MMHVGDTKSTSGDVQYIGGYHEYSRGYHESYQALYGLKHYNL